MGAQTLRRRGWTLNLARLPAWVITVLVFGVTIGAIVWAMFFA